MPDLHLIITEPEPGEWWGRLDVTEALEAAGWTGDESRTVLRKNGALWALTNETGESGLDCPNGAVIEFPSNTPTVVIIAACLAAAETQSAES
ncbi:hypothetical protein [Streptomyces sp. NPDC048521]|uniref:hypothetical protein n=1 Tax=Streptomyces sp. NPDC048521 TaxID=3365566 RepID=UPI00371399D9